MGQGERLLRRGDYVDGSFIKPERIDGYIVGVNPGSRADALGRFAFSAQSAEAAFEAAVRASYVWPRVSLEDRAAVVRTFTAHLQGRSERLAALITRETGKPLWESRQEVQSAVRATALLLEDGVPLLKPRVVQEDEAWSERRPHGVVGVLSPWVYPIQVPAMQCAAALLAGNTVVFKPSKFTPGCGQAIAEIFDQCRLPRGAFNMVQGSGASVGQRMVTEPSLGALLFTGSWSSALVIRRALADRPDLPAVFQCGGKASALVLEGANLDQAVHEIVIGACLTAGQRHDATARAIVLSDHLEAFLERVVARVGRIKVGYGFDDDVFCGPVISDNYRSRARRFVGALQSRGHRVLVGGGPIEVPGRRGFYLSPSVVEMDWRRRHPFLNEEPPGPLLMVYAVDSWEEGVALHDQLAYRLSTSVFLAPDHPHRDEILVRLHTGCLNVNRGTLGTSMRLAPVGFGRSSNGLGADVDLVRFLAPWRATLVDRRPFDPGRRVPGMPL